jgi:hypothetical protein
MITCPDSAAGWLDGPAGMGRAQAACRLAGGVQALGALAQLGHAGQQGAAAGMAALVAGHVGQAGTDIVSGATQYG